MTQKQFYSTTAWKYLRMSVLLFYSNDGVVKCSTCGKFMILPSKDAQGGHWIKSNESRATALEFNNIAPQCYTCNKYHSGRPEIMEKFLREQHGDKAIDMLLIKKHNICKLDKFTLDYFAGQHKKMFHELVKTKGNPFKK
jgi:hypothetical protein